MKSSKPSKWIRKLKSSLENNFEQDCQVSLYTIKHLMHKLDQQRKS